MDRRNSDLKDSWKQRHGALGNTRRSVLYKNFPEFLNNYIHASHVKFVLNQLPRSPRHVLDLGCGYGRISAEIQNVHPSAKLQGVELCDEFAEQFRRDLGDCASATIQEYVPTEQFDVILFVTVLMYVAPDEVAANLARYWDALAPGGRLIVIEPCDNALIWLRKKTKARNISPTGGSLVHYFASDELGSHLDRLSGSRIIRKENFGLFPLLGVPRLHCGFSVEKAAHS